MKLQTSWTIILFPIAVPYLATHAGCRLFVSIYLAIMAVFAVE